MKRKIVIQLLFVIMLLAAATGASAITFGVPDAGEHPYVGLIYFEIESGVFRCSGTLMTPTVVLTAGHCTSENGHVATRAWVTFDEVLNIPPDKLELPDAEFGDWLDTQSNFIKGTAVPHPQYDDFHQYPATYDVGVILLSSAPNISTFGQLPTVGYLEQFTTGQGQRMDDFEVVGYGRQGFINPFARVERARYKGEASLIELKSHSNAGMSAKFTNTPGSGTGSGGTCFGDSGGPVFKNNTNLVVAVVSWGITPCIGVDYQFRVDTALAQGFLHNYLP